MKAIKEIKFMNSRENCNQCGKKLKKIDEKFCSKECKEKYESY